MWLDWCVKSDMCNGLKTLSVGVPKELEWDDSCVSEERSAERMRLSQPTLSTVQLFSCSEANRCDSFRCWVKQRDLRQSK